METYVKTVKNEVWCGTCTVLDHSMSNNEFEPWEKPLYFDQTLLGICRSSMLKFLKVHWNQTSLGNSDFIQKYIKALLLEEYVINRICIKSFQVFWSGLTFTIRLFSVALTMIKQTYFSIFGLKSQTNWLA